jgi:hypothetical protein
MYLILYAMKLPNGKTLGGFYCAWAPSLAEAEKIFMSISLTPECFRKEIWWDDGKGYRKLYKMEEFDYAKMSS